MYKDFWFKYKLAILLVFFLSPFSFFKMVGAQTSGLSISEIMYDPAGSDDKHEWVEIQNTGTESVPIVGGSSSNAWRFYDGSNHTLQFYQGAGSLEPGTFLVLADDPVTFLADHPGFSATLYKTPLSLNNDADTLKLSLDGGETWVGEISYSKDMGASGNNYTLEKEGSNLRQSYILAGTPGRVSSTQSDKPVYSRDIILNEILPQPSTGTNDEFIELKNIGPNEIDLAGWQLDDQADGGSSVHIISASREGGTKIAPNGFLVFYKPETGLALNDGGDDVRLIAPDSQELEKLSYPKAIKGQSYAKNENGGWAWNAGPTAGANNVFTTLSTSSTGTPSAQSSQTQNTNPSSNDTTQNESTQPISPSNNVSTQSSASQKLTKELSSSSSSTKKPKVKKSNPLPINSKNQDAGKTENEELAKKLTEEVKGVKTSAPEGKSLYLPFKNSVKIALGVSVLFLILLILEGMLRWQREKAKTKR